MNRYIQFVDAEVFSQIGSKGADDEGSKGVYGVLAGGAGGAAKVSR